MITPIQSTNNSLNSSVGVERIRVPRKSNLNSLGSVSFTGKANLNTVSHNNLKELIKYFIPKA